MIGERWIDRDGCYAPATRMAARFTAPMFSIFLIVGIAAQAARYKDPALLILLVPALAIVWTTVGRAAWARRESLLVLEIYVALWGWMDEPSRGRLQRRLEENWK